MDIHKYEINSKMLPLTALSLKFGYKKILFDVWKSIYVPVLNSFRTHNSVCGYLCPKIWIVDINIHHEFMKSKLRFMDINVLFWKLHNHLFFFAIRNPR